MVKKNLLLVGLMGLSLVMPQATKATDNYIKYAKYAGISLGAIFAGSAIYKLYQKYQQRCDRRIMLNTSYGKLLASDKVWNKQGRNGTLIKPTKYEDNDAEEDTKYLNTIQADIDTAYPSVGNHGCNVSIEVRRIANTNQSVRNAEKESAKEGFLYPIAALQQVRQQVSRFDQWFNSDYVPAYEAAYIRDKAQAYVNELENAIEAEDNESSDSDESVQ